MPTLYGERLTHCWWNHPIIAGFGRFRQQGARQAECHQRTSGPKYTSYHIVGQGAESGLELRAQAHATFARTVSSCRKVIAERPHERTREISTRCAGSKKYQTILCGNYPALRRQFSRLNGHDISLFRGNNFIVTECIVWSNVQHVRALLACLSVVMRHI
jgi:hypothetical protein